MNNKVKFGAFFYLLILSSLSFADLFNYEVKFPSSNSNSLYPGLDLNGLQLIEITKESSIYEPQAKITQVKLTFPNATDLIARNFSFDGNMYRAVVHGAWVYKTVVVELNGPELQVNTPVDVRVFVVEHQSNLNDPHQTFGTELLNANGSLFDVTPNPLADTTSIVVDDKKLILRLFKRVSSDVMTAREGFKIETRWLGKGDRFIYVPAPLPAPTSERINAIGIDVQTQTFPDGFVEHLFQIRYEDETGSVITTPMEPLRLYLDQAYSQSP